MKTRSKTRQIVAAAILARPSVFNVAYEILLVIIEHLPLNAAIPLAMTCKRIYALTDERIFWILTLLETRKTRALPLPPFQDLQSLTLAQLKDAAHHFLRLEKNWSRHCQSHVVKPATTLNLPRTASILFIIPGTGLLVINYRAEKIACWNIHTKQFVCDVRCENRYGRLRFSPHYEAGRCLFVLESGISSMSVFAVKFGSTETSISLLWSRRSSRSGYIAHCVLGSTFCGFAEVFDLPPNAEFDDDDLDAGYDSGFDFDDAVPMKSEILLVDVETGSHRATFSSPRLSFNILRFMYFSDSDLYVVAEGRPWGQVIMRRYTVSGLQKTTKVTLEKKSHCGPRIPSSFSRDYATGNIIIDGEIRDHEARYQPFFHGDGPTEFFEVWKTGAGKAVSLLYAETDHSFVSSIGLSSRLTSENGLIRFIPQEDGIVQTRRVGLGLERFHWPQMKIDDALGIVVTVEASYLEGASVVKCFHYA
ncbi:hypothetical protein C8J56DRAFT_1105340 [Mycena floridula]|nr:hypothetical protein C8J56DRAFT_1105340 [Mycena floridula]